MSLKSHLKRKKETLFFEDLTLTYLGDKESQLFLAELLLSSLSPSVFISGLVTAYYFLSVKITESGGKKGLIHC